MWEQFLSTQSGQSILKLIRKENLELLINERHSYLKHIEKIFCHQDKKKFVAETCSSFKETYDRNVHQINLQIIHPINLISTPVFFNNFIQDMQKVLPVEFLRFIQNKKPLNWSFETENQPLEVNFKSLTGILVWISLLLAFKAPENWNRLLSKLVIRDDRTPETHALHEGRINTVKMDYTADHSDNWSATKTFFFDRKTQSFTFAEFKIPAIYLKTIQDIETHGIFYNTFFISEEITFAHECIHIKHETKGTYLGPRGYVLDGAEESDSDDELDVELTTSPLRKDSFDDLATSPLKRSEHFEGLKRSSGGYLRRNTVSTAIKSLEFQERKRGPIPPKRRTKLITAIQHSFGDHSIIGASGETRSIPEPLGQWTPEEYMTVIFGKLTENSFRQELQFLPRNTYNDE